MLTSSAATTLIQAIIANQQSIIGPLAFERASRVTGLSVSKEKGVSIEVQASDYASVIEKLVLQYKELFGQTSVEVCKEAVREARVSVSSKDLPSILQ